MADGKTTNTVTTPAVASTVLENILNWSQDCPTWQKDALRRILQKNEIDENDTKELLQILKAENSKKPSNITPRPLEKNHLPANPEVSETIKISKLSNISHVNNLAPHQGLEFEDKGITVIYGGNGSGKSGYARILKNACSARHRDKILPNIFVPADREAIPSADIHYSTKNQTNNVVNWQDNVDPHNILSAVYVFDRECANVHMRKNGNEIAFSPYGLDIPETLVHVCKSLASSLNAEIEQVRGIRNAIFSDPPWQPTTIAGNFVSGITKDTSPTDLDAISNFTEEDETRLQFLTETLARDIKKAIDEEKLKASKLERIKSDLSAKTKPLSEAKMKAIMEHFQVAESARKTADIAAESLIEGNLPDVGREVWTRMWLAAKEYSEKSAYIGESFPHTEGDAKCVLCQQDLGDTAKNRLQAFNEHIIGDLENDANQKKRDYDQLSSESDLPSIRFSDYQEIFEDIGIINLPLLKIVKRYIASIRLRQLHFIRIIKREATGNLSEYSESPFEALEQQIEKHKLVELELANSESQEGRKKLEAEQQQLEDRKTVKKYRLDILKEIQRLQEINLLEKCLEDTKTRKITLLGNNIADDVITPKMTARFQEEILSLVGNRVRVELERSGGREGSPKYKLSLTSSTHNDLPKVLSEGEQASVTIALFLAELATSSHKSALVFDDPVSSLDHAWRSKVADRLVKEAQIRQVIVFTHDLVFLNDLEGASNDKNVVFSSRHLSRTPNNVGIVKNDLPWNAMKIGARIDALEKLARALQKERNDLMQEEYNEKARVFFDDMRSAWERALEEVGLSHVVMRHRDYIDAKNINKISALNIELCQDWYRSWSHCCDYIKSHDTARARNENLPEPDELLQETVELSNWVATIRAKKKQIPNQ